MIRSALFIPGNNPSMMQTADVFGADSVIFDLEDSVHINEKASARNLIKDYLLGHPVLPSKVILRVNAPDTADYSFDLQLLDTLKIDGIMLPKASEKSTKALAEMLKIKEESLGRQFDIIPIIELASSFLELKNIASVKGVTGLLLGGEDFCSDMEIKRTREGKELWFPRAELAIVSRALGIDAIDTPFADVNDDEGLTQDALMASSLGMTAKAAIHPRQIPLIHAVFSPSNDQILWAKNVLDAEKKASKNGLGVFSLDGKMIDQPIIKRARTITQKAQRYEVGVPENEE
ncbi:MAG: CoA ester lyase [Candidatus Izemoplasmatales bacterium]|jgi:citrate lyase subunit beta/citryl-CoA lyase